MQTTNIVELTPENFQSILIETSQQKLVLVAFWAQQVEESVPYIAQLEQLVSNHGEHLVLAKVDCQTQQQIAMQFGIQNIPTIVLFKEGQPLDGLAGAQPLENVQQLLEKHLPKPEVILLQQAQLLIAAEQYAEAFPMLKEANQLAPDNIDIVKALADVQLGLGKAPEAELLLAEIKMVDQDDYYQSLMAKLDLLKEAADTPEIQALEQQLAAQPDNVELVVKLAVQLHQVQRNEDALEKLFTILKVDLNGADGEAKKVFMDIIQTLPAGDALATQYRRRLYSLLY